jgi:hypothetical protein
MIEPTYGEYESDFQLPTCVSSRDRWTRIHMLSVYSMSLGPHHQVLPIRATCLGDPQCLYTRFNNVLHHSLVIDESSVDRNSKGRRLTTVQVFIMRLQSPRNTVNSRAGAPSFPPSSGCSNARWLLTLLSNCPRDGDPLLHPAASLETIDFRLD